MAALLEIVLTGQVYGELMVNRFNYRADGSVPASGYAFGLADVMGFHPASAVADGGTILSAITGLQVSAASWAQSICRDVYNPLDYDDFGFVPSVPGLVASTDGAAPFYAMGLRTNRVRGDIGRGYKRIGGISEASVTAGGDIEAGALTGLGTLADLMSDVLSYTEGGVTVQYTPVVVSKEKYTSPSGKDAYRYYSTYAVQATHLAVGITWQPYETVRSQVSRQYGRGA